VAEGASSHAEGAETISSGGASHAEGYRTTSSGTYSHAGGESSIASGLRSFVHGSGSTASGTDTIVLGTFINGTANNTTYVEAISFKGSDFKWKFISIPINGWNMDTTTTVSIAHGLSSSEWGSISQIGVIIRNDAATTHYDLLKPNGGSIDGGITSITNTNINLERRTSGFFDSTDFNDGVFPNPPLNRGWITFWYIPD
jgi:hypothetical protein